MVRAVARIGPISQLHLLISVTFHTYICMRAYVRAYMHVCTHISTRMHTYIGLEWLACITTCYFLLYKYESDFRHKNIN